MQTVVESIMHYVKEKQLNEGSGHDWWHTFRVYQNACDIANHHDERLVNMQVVELGALLHDLADHKFGYDDADRTLLITELLHAQEVPEIEIAAVIDIANTISFKGGVKNVPLSSIEAKIVQDADRLDALGAIGIARTFTYGGFMHRQIYHPEGLTAQPDTIQHFYDKLLVLKDTMNTAYGKQKAEERHQFMKIYLQQFYAEWNGER